MQHFNLVIIGSGSGKSTLLTIAGSLEEPTSGDVLVCGMALAGMPPGRKARLRRRVMGTCSRISICCPG